MRLPPKHPFLDRIFHYKPSSDKGVPPLQETSTYHVQNQKSLTHHASIPFWKVPHRGWCGDLHHLAPPELSTCTVALTMDFRPSNVRTSCRIAGWHPFWERNKESASWDFGEFWWIETGHLKSVAWKRNACRHFKLDPLDSNLLISSLLNS